MQIGEETEDFTDVSQVTLTQVGVGSKTYTANPVRTFDDKSPTAYWDSRIPWSSIRTAGSGVKLTVVSASKDHTSHTVELSSDRRPRWPPATGGAAGR